jgi:hypothetical protein
MLAALAEITATRVLEDADLSVYGLDAPICTIRIPAKIATGGDAADAWTGEIAIGDETPLGGERYLSVGDGNVYIIGAALYDAFACHTESMVQTDAVAE